MGFIGEFEQSAWFCKKKIFHEEFLKENETGTAKPQAHKFYTRPKQQDFLYPKEFLFQIIITECDKII